MLSCFSCVQLCVTPWTVAHQAPLSMGFSRQECWSGFPMPPPGALPDPGMEPTSLMSPVLADGFFTTSATWEALANSISVPFFWLYWDITDITYCLSSRCEHTSIWYTFYLYIFLSTCGPPKCCLPCPQTTNIVSHQAISHCVHPQQSTPREWNRFLDLDS